MQQQKQPQGFIPCGCANTLIFCFLTTLQSRAFYLTSVAKSNGEQHAFVLPCYREQGANSLESNQLLFTMLRRACKGGYQYAIVATANKIACIYYKMVRFKLEFTPVDVKEYRIKYNQAKISYLERKLEKLKAAEAA